jgi:uncharacterized protein YaaW (UPF0174 family)
MKDRPLRKSIITSTGKFELTKSFFNAEESNVTAGMADAVSVGGDGCCGCFSALSAKSVGLDSTLGSGTGPVGWTVDGATAGATEEVSSSLSLKS